jgi:hypothetical protein
MTDARNVNAGDADGCRSIPGKVGSMNAESADAYFANRPIAAGGSGPACEIIATPHAGAFKARWEKTERYPPAVAPTAALSHRKRSPFSAALALSRFAFSEDASIARVGCLPIGLYSLHR